MGITKLWVVFIWEYRSCFFLMYAVVLLIMIDVVRYDKDNRREWDEVVAGADNAHFMASRTFIEYHKDRFIDHSILIYRNGKLVGVLPANQSDDTFYSHQGLTFGGLFVRKKYNRCEIICEIMSAVIAYVRKMGFKKFIYKFCSHIYHKRPCCADYYALCRLSEEVPYSEICHVSSTVMLNRNIAFSSSRKNHAKQALKYNLRIEQRTDAWNDYWSILSERLRERFQKKPVHSLDEITFLAKSFPEKIKLFVVFSEDNTNDILGGTVIFETDEVAHVQYTAVRSEHQNKGVLDYLFLELIKNYQKSGHTCFDFGISTSTKELGKIFNKGLLDFKEAFGATPTLTLIRNMVLS